MFVVTEAEAAAIRATFEQRGELAAAVELRRLFPGITDITRAVQRSQLMLHLNSSSSPARAAAYLSWLNVEF